ncbi:MAG TPA: carbonic anhydrase [Xanthomonadales bacterium]|nr:carbonic anhydrase [Xanthomonadales bacterium]
MMHHSRSEFLTGASALLVAASGKKPAATATPAIPTLEASADPPSCPLVGPVEAIARLVAGNDRFANGHLKHVDQSPGRRMQVAPHQCPFAAVIDCADSRVSPELLFDQGLGDLFVCRTAGNVADTAVTGSIEYAAEHFHPSLILVLGHERCGAVGAALDTLHGGVLPPASIGALVRQIIPNVRGVAAGPDQWGQAVAANAAAVAAELRLSPILAPRIKTSKLRVVSATYGLESGRVSFAAG